MGRISNGKVILVRPSWFVPLDPHMTQCGREKGVEGKIQSRLRKIQVITCPFLCFPRKFQSGVVKVYCFSLKIIPSLGSKGKTMISSFSYWF